MIYTVLYLFFGDLFESLDVLHRNIRKSTAETATVLYQDISLQCVRSKGIVSR